MTRTKNVGRQEAIFRSVLGVILIILAFFFSGIFRWVLGFVGMASILTGLLGY